MYVCLCIHMHIHIVHHFYVCTLLLPSFSYLSLFLTYCFFLSLILSHFSFNRLYLLYPPLFTILNHLTSSLQQSQSDNGAVKVSEGENVQEWYCLVKGSPEAIKKLLNPAKYVTRTVV